MTTFLQLGASRSRLIQAAAQNHVDWFAANARAAGGEVLHTNGATWVVAGKSATLAFPRLDETEAGDVLDTVVAECRTRQLEGVSCWSLSPTRPRDLGARLAARGFEWGWRPHWMALDLATLPPVSAPDGVAILVDASGEWDVEDLPYYKRDDAPARQALAQAEPRRTWHFAAVEAGKIVGQSAVHVTTGTLGVAGIYNVGVVPGARGRGIGSAVSLAACHQARSSGCRYALLNSAADGLYNGLGFRSLGYGQTWWMHAPTLAAPPPTPAEVAFAEAVGRGDTDALNRLPHPGTLDLPLASGATLVELAVRARKPASARWLQAHGATVDLLHAWDLGWKGAVRKRLAVSPESVNERRGAGQTTLLHDAVWRSDIALVRLLLTARPDLSIEDGQFHSTPLGWARHLKRTEIASLLEAV